LVANTDGTYPQGYLLAPEVAIQPMILYNDPAVAPALAFLPARWSATGQKMGLIRLPALQNTKQHRTQSTSTA
jgi:hypothetical protein